MTGEGPAPERLGPRPHGPAFAVVQGGLYGLVFVAPAAVVAEVFADDNGRIGGGLTVAVTLVQLLGFTFAGYATRRLSPDAPLSHCALAGVVCWAILQAVGVVTSLVRGNDLHPLSIVATALLGAAVAAGGGLVASYPYIGRGRTRPGERS